MAVTPKISVIMTVYNGEGFLQEALDGVWAQTYDDFELVVVNNGSTDGTQAILDANNDPRLRVVRAPSHGTFGDGIRLAYRQANGRYIAVHDADDVSFPDRFEKQITALEADHSLGLVFGAFQDMDKDGNLSQVHRPPRSRQNLVDAFQTHNPLAHSTYMYRRVAADQVFGYPMEYAYGPDFALVIRLMKKGWGVKVLDEVLLKLRLHPGQTSILPSFSVTRAHDALYLFREAARLDNVSAKAKRGGTRHIVKCMLQYALALIADGQLQKGAKQVFYGLLRHPIYGLVYLAYRLGLRMGLMRPIGPTGN